MLSQRNQQTSSKVSSETEEHALGSEICRICLKNGKIPIFGVNDLSEAVTRHGGIEISHDDNLPQHICNSCYALLKSATLFRELAKSSDEMLKGEEHLEEESVCSTEEDYCDNALNDSDSDFNIKKEYLEYEDSCCMDSEMEWTREPATDYDSVTDDTLSQTDRKDMDIKKEPEEDLLSNDEDEKVDENLVYIIPANNEGKRNKIFNSCAKCNTVYKNRTAYNNHVCCYEEIDPDLLTSQKCDICQKLIEIVDYEEHVKQHREKYINNHKKKYGKVNCEVCNKKINKAYYKYHMKMHGSAKEQSERVVQCAMCNKSFSSHYIFEHVQRVHDKKQNMRTQQKKRSDNTLQQFKKCPVCDKDVSETTYKEHLAKHGSSKKCYICEQCGRQFKTKSSFNTHVLTHGGELKYKCQFCPYRGLHEGLLRVHVKTHTKDYKYKCTECPAKFLTKSNLSQHCRRHFGESKFKCDTCHRGFYFKRDVERHIKSVHLQLKNVVCDLCGKGFGHRDYLLCHQRKVHKRQNLYEGKGRRANYLIAKTQD